jgi:hypothetical protein
MPEESNDKVKTVQKQLENVQSTMKNNIELVIKRYTP